MPPFCYVYKFELRRRSKFRLRRRGPGGQRCRTPPQARHGAGVRRAQLSAPPRGAPKPQTDQDSVAQGALEPPGAVRGNGSASEKGPSGPKEAKVKVTHVGGPSVVCGACAGIRARRDVSKGVRSADTQAALTGARTTPSARADAHGRIVRRTHGQLVLWTQRRGTLDPPNATHRALREGSSALDPW